MVNCLREFSFRNFSFQEFFWKLANPPPPPPPIPPVISNGKQFDPSKHMFLAVRIGKFGPLREPIRMLLYNADQFNYIIEKFIDYRILKQLTFLLISRWASAGMFFVRIGSGVARLLSVWAFRVGAYR